MCRPNYPFLAHDEQLKHAPYGRIMLLWNPTCFSITAPQFYWQFIHIKAHRTFSNSTFITTFVDADKHFLAIIFLKGWNKHTFGNPMFILRCKLKNTKNEVRKWVEKLLVKKSTQTLSGKT